MTCKFGIRVVLATIALHAGGIALADAELMDQCLLTRLKAADIATTVAELKAACEEQIGAQQSGNVADPGVQSPTVVDLRREADLEARENRFAISAYRPTYLLYSHNNNPNEAPYGNGETDFFDQEEAKFQVSFQMPIATELFGGNTDLVFAYTSTSWWQVFNDDIQNPFRETNYEPEIFFHNFSRAEILGLDFVSWEIGFNHQSNGQSGSLSRGWDRLIGGTAIELGENLVLGLRAWHIVDYQEETNPGIYRYMGYGDIGVGWSPNRNSLSLMYRPATEGDAVQLTWSYPISRHLRVYAQYWNGYGESLIDYNVRTKRFGIGVALSDFLERQ